MSFVEETSTKGISLKFPPMTSVPNTDKNNLVENPLATVIEHFQVQNTAFPIMYTVPVSNIAVNQQQTEITQIAPEPLSASSTLQETLQKICQENSMSKMQANVPVSNLQYFQLPKSSKPVVPPAAETIQTLFIFNKTRFSASSIIIP